MPPSDYGFGTDGATYHDGDYAGGPPGDPAPEAPRADRFTRNDWLGTAAQKVYDQLVDQRDRIAAINPEAANKMFGPHSDLTANEGMVLMAQEFAESGITDIYKVKKETVTDRLPIQYGVIQEGGEGSDVYGWFYDDPVRGRVGVDPNDPNQVKDFKKETYAWDPYALTTDGEGGASYGAVVSTPGSGFVEVPRTQYLNTETNQPLAIDQYGQYQGNDKILQSRGVADRVKIGYGIDFNDAGMPMYFQEAYKEPSRWKRFTNSFWESPIAPIIGALSGNPFIAASLAGARAAYGPGDFGDALKAAALSFATSKALELSGATEGIKSLLGGAAPSFDPASALETQFALPGLEFSNLPVPSWDTGYPGSPEVPTGSLGLPDYVDDLFSGSGVAPTPDVAFPELFAPPGAGYDLGYALNEVNQPFTPEPTLDPTLGDPTAAPGGMPKMPMTPEEFAANVTSDPYIASELAGSHPSTWDPPWYAAAGAGIKALLNNPVGQFIAGKALQSLVGGGPQGIQIPGGTGSGSGIAQPSLQYAQVPEFDVTKAFSPTLYAMRQQKQG